jgi:hypothetical protein
MITGKRKHPKIFHQTDLGAGKYAFSINQRAHKNPNRNYLASDFKFVDGEKYVKEYVKYGEKPFAENLHFLKGGALTAINRMNKLGVKTKQFVIAMGTRNLLNPKYLGRIAKNAKSVLTKDGSIYFVSTWAPSHFRKAVVPFFEKEGYFFEELKPDVERQMDHSGKAISYHFEYGDVQWEYKFKLKK